MWYFMYWRIHIFTTRFAAEMDFMWILFATVLSLSIDLLWSHASGVFLFLSHFAIFIVWICSLCMFFLYTVLCMFAAHNGNISKECMNITVSVVYISFLKSLVTHIFRNFFVVSFRITWNNGLTAAIIINVKIFIFFNLSMNRE